MWWWMIDFDIARPSKTGFSEVSTMKTRQWLSLSKNKLVHEHLRCPNIILSNSKVFAVDFHWSCKEDKGYYPLDMIKNNQWAQGVDREEKLMCDHDKRMAVRLLSSCYRIKDWLTLTQIWVYIFHCSFFRLGKIRRLAKCQKAPLKLPIGIGFRKTGEFRLK